MSIKSSDNRLAIFRYFKTAFGIQLHAYQKKAQNIRHEDIELAARRYKQVVNDSG